MKMTNAKVSLGFAVGVVVTVVTLPVLVLYWALEKFDAKGKGRE